MIVNQHCDPVQKVFPCMRVFNPTQPIHRSNHCVRGVGLIEREYSSSGKIPSSDDVEIISHGLPTCPMMLMVLMLVLLLLVVVVVWGCCCCCCCFGWWWCWWWYWWWYRGSSFHHLSLFARLPACVGWGQHWPGLPIACTQGCLQPPPQLIANITCILSDQHCQQMQDFQLREDGGEKCQPEAISTTEWQSPISLFGTPWHCSASVGTPGWHCWDTSVTMSGILWHLTKCSRCTCAILLHLTNTAWHIVSHTLSCTPCNILTAACPRIPTISPLAGFSYSSQSEAFPLDSIGSQEKRTVSCTLHNMLWTAMYQCVLLHKISLYIQRSSKTI